jgi:pimeloyl-ACP methyl ester carboxylesterase
MNDSLSYEGRPSWTFFIPILAISFLIACGGSPHKKIAVHHGFTGVEVQGEGFRHQIYKKEGLGELIHVYIEGDGRPWLNPQRVSLDPTSRHPTMLKLMAMDLAPAVYLGRPCYMNAVDERCNYLWWTSNRYAAEVVESLNAVIDQVSGEASGVALFGFSGGGALAMLLASRRSDVDVVVTLAGNLDIEAWTQQHGYSALSGSLNPSDQAPLDPRIRQYHLVGSEDRNVTAAMIAPVVSNQVDASLIIVEGYDHRCCWNKLWPEILAMVSADSLD